jgi:hypothetical protein
MPRSTDRLSSQGTASPLRQGMQGFGVGEWQSVRAFVRLNSEARRPRSPGQRDRRGARPVSGLTWPSDAGRLRASAMVGSNWTAGPPRVATRAFRPSSARNRRAPWGSKRADAPPSARRPGDRAGPALSRRPCVVPNCRRSGLDPVERRVGSQSDKVDAGTCGRSASTPARSGNRGMPRGGMRLTPRNRARPPGEGQAVLDRHEPAPARRRRHQNGRPALPGRSTAKPPREPIFGVVGDVSRVHEPASRLGAAVARSSAGIDDLSGTQSIGTAGPPGRHSL